MLWSLFINPIPLSVFPDGQADVHPGDWEFWVHHVGPQVQMGGRAQVSTGKWTVSFHSENILFWKFVTYIWFKQCAFDSEHNFQKYTLHCSWHTHTFISIYTIDLYGKFEFTLSFILCSKKATKIIFGQISNHRNLSERKRYKNFSCSESFSMLLEPFWRQALWQQI